MYLTAHAAVGVLISQQTQNPWIALWGSFLSHFVLDFVPHGDEGVGEWVVMKKTRMAFLGFLDLLGIAVLVFALAKVVTLPTFGLVALGIVGAILPDFLANIFPVIHQLAERNLLVRFVNWAQLKIQLAPLLRQHRRFHHWIHNPWHDLLPLRVSREIGVLVQLFILFVFFATEISILGK